MRVRILSGNNTGAVVEMDQAEAQNAIATGYAAEVSDAAAPPEVEPTLVQARRPSRADLRRPASPDAEPPENE